MGGTLELKTLNICSYDNRKMAAIKKYLVLPSLHSNVLHAQHTQKACTECLLWARSWVEMEACSKGT